jgi:hypothetical protein
MPYWDTDLTGFGVLCSGKTSAKSFIVQRDLPGGKSRRVTIANVSELKFADAKERARKLLLDMRGGKDPKGKHHYSSLMRIQLAPLKDRLLGSITPNEVDQLHRNIVGRSVANDAMKCRDDDLGRNPIRLVPPPNGKASAEYHSFLRTTH